MNNLIIKILRISVLFFITTNAISSVVFYEPLSGRKPPGSSRKVELDLQPYVERFEELWGNKISFPVVFSNLEHLTAGKCTVWFFGDKIVEVDSAYFLILNELEREQLIFHELGHCALKRMEHSNERIIFEGETRKAPKSIMHETLFNMYDMRFYRKNRQYYLDELFGRLK